MQLAKLPWYVIRVRSNCERIVSLNLREKGYDTYLPLYRSRRHWADRTKELMLPLFPGYTFCRLDAQRRLPILESPGVVSILGSSTGPIAVEDYEIDAVSRMLSSDLPVGPWPLLRTGQTVVVERGPLAGLEGVVVRVKTSFRLVVSVALLNRSIYAEVEHDWIRPISEPFGASRSLCQ